MANDMSGINDIYENGMNDVYGEIPSGQNRLPKSGQTTSYQVGDDGEWETGLVIEDRFEIATLEGDAVVIDHATGLMFPRSRDGDGCNNNTPATWEDAVTFCDNLDFAGFTDWRLSNHLQMLSIYDYGTNRLYSAFLNFQQYLKFWTSNTKVALTTLVLVFVNSDSPSTHADKTASHYIMPCREYKMIIEKTKDGLKITHPTGVVQVISKAELLSIIAERDERITELQSEKAVMQADVAEIDVLIAK